jgi:hypothetical protein
MSENEEKIFPRKRVYKRRSAEKRGDPEATKKTAGLPLEDLEALRELMPRLTPKGQEVLGLLLKVFDQDGQLNTEQLLQLINFYVGQSPNPALQQLMSLWPLISSASQGGNQPINPALLTGLLGMMMPNRPK